MNYDELIVALRERVGRPAIDEVNDRRLLAYLNSALEWLAGELGYNPTDDTLNLSANIHEYDLDEGVAEILWAKHAGRILEPASITQWVRDGVDWQNAAAGQPQQYAFEGTLLFLYPPPNSAAAALDLTYGYLPAAPAVATTGATGTPLLSNANQGLLLWKAAEEYFCGTITAENVAQRGAQIQAAQAQVMQRLGNAKRQVTHGARASGPPPSVFSRGTGAAR